MTKALQTRFFALLLLGAVLAVTQDSFLKQSSGNPGLQSGGERPDLKVKKSDVIIGFEWAGEAIAYPPPAPGDDLSVIGPLSPWFSRSSLQIRGDTFPMTWADDDEIYASAGDPNWGGKNDGLDVEKFSGMPPHYTISRVNPMTDYTGSGGEGTKPTGLICVKGVLYLAFQNFLGLKPPASGDKSQHGDDAVIVASRDHGKTWMPAIKSLKAPMFPGNRFGGPAFINFGRNNAQARDEYLYAVSTDQWDNGSHLLLGRVLADRVLEAGAWEWVAALNPARQPRWSKKLDEAIPILSDGRRISLPDMVYIAAIKRYVLLTWSLKKDFSPDDGSELVIYDAPELWGPFTLVHHESPWESVDINPYCPRLPLKWLQTSAQGVTGWLQFSGSWRQDSLHYRSHVRKFTIRVRKPQGDG